MSRYDNTAKLIAETRKHLGLTQWGLGYLTGAGRSQISNIERGVVGVPCKYIKSLADNLAITPSEIIANMVEDYKSEIARRM